jgi:hypothetical protein
MRIGQCRDGNTYVESRFDDGSFPEVYDVEGEYVHDLELADTFHPVGEPIEILDILPIGHDRNPNFFVALASLRERLPLRHTTDADCTLDDDDQCIRCGVSHTCTCPSCGGRGFHKDACPEIED